MPIFSVKVINNCAVFNDKDIYHITKVLRKKVNAIINGYDNYFIYDIKINSLNPFATEIIAKKMHHFEVYPINIYLAIISKKSFMTGCKILNEINCKSITPVRFARSQGNIKIAYDKLQLIVNESCKQAKRIIPLDIKQEISFASLVKKINYNNWYVAFENETKNYNLKKDFQYGSEINIIIGPEGGITKHEMAQLEKAKIVGLTKTILKSENAAFF